MSVQDWLARDRRGVLKTLSLGSLILLTAAWAVPHFAMKTFKKARRVCNGIKQ